LQQAAGRAQFTASCFFVLKLKTYKVFETLIGLNQFIARNDAEAQRADGGRQRQQTESSLQRFRTGILAHNDAATQRFGWENAEGSLWLTAFLCKAEFLLKHNLKPSALSLSRNVPSKKHLKLIT
jgi:hypothetical protein